MEFQEFCKNYKRMCDAIGCKECGINKTITRNKDLPDDCDSFCISYSDQAEPIVEQWVKENPVVTNEDKFREVFGFDIAMVSGLLNEEWLKREYKEPEENS